jgi:hypothetical protein
MEERGENYGLRGVMGRVGSTECKKGREEGVERKRG